MPGRDEEFRDFVAARSAALLRVAYLLTGDTHIAEDLLQAALTKTYLAWHRIRDHAAVEAYVKRTLATTATSWWRRRWHGERPSAEPPESAQPDRTAESDDRDVVWRHIRALPARQRAVIVLRYYEDLSEQEIATVLGCAPGTVKSQASRALATLRARLADEAGTPSRLGASR